MFGGEFHSLFAAGFGFTVEGLRDGCRTAHFAQGENLDFVFSSLIFDLKHIADADVASRLGKMFVGFDTAHLAGFLCEGPRLEEAGGPKPFVDTD